jgi:penicillin-binding protein 1A
MKREVAEGMNWMMNKVVNEGTGKNAQLDFTNVAGKTGTSTGPNDVWFVGFTGKYVGVVWLGRDNNKPMSGTTGGGFAAPIWHSIMSKIHTDMNIPTIPGLQPHPRQVAEQQRLASLRTQGALEPSAGDAKKGSSSLMPDRTRDTLKRLTNELRKAAGLAEPEGERKSPADPGGGPARGDPPPGKRAQGQTPRIALPAGNRLGAAQPPIDEKSRRALP